jgi:hypothetical protein
MACELKSGETVLTGLLQDRSALFGVLGQIEALGLELLELRRMCGQSRPSAEVNPPGSARPSDPSMTREAEKS